MEAIKLETKKIRQVFRGEIYYANLSGAIGSEQQGTRPVLIVQNNTGNVHSPTVMVLPITKKLDVINPQPTHIDIKNFCGLEYECTILAEQIRTIDKSRLREKIGNLPYKLIKTVNEAMQIAQGIKN